MPVDTRSRSTVSGPAEWACALCPASIFGGREELDHRGEVLPPQPVTAGEHVEIVSESTGETRDTEVSRRCPGQRQVLGHEIGHESRGEVAVRRRLGHEAR